MLRTIFLTCTLNGRESILGLMRVGRCFLQIAMVATLLFGCDKKTEEAPSGPAISTSNTSVLFAARPKGIRTEVIEDVASMALSLPGRLTWDEDHTVRVYTPFTGRVLHALVQVGESVKAGQPLAELASPDFGQAQADARKAAADMKLAQQTFNRSQELNSVGVVALKDLQQAQADLYRAEAENSRAQTRLKQVGASHDENFVLKAPIGGVVVDKSINPGQELRPDQGGAPLFIITDPSHLWVWIDAPESEIPRLQSVTLGAKFNITSAAYPEESFVGQLIQTADFIDPASRTFKLRGSVENPQRLLKTEMFVTATFPISPPSNNVLQQTVATSAVILIGERRYIFVQDNDKQFTRVEVHVLREQAGRTTVTGLPAGKNIVVEGNLYLQQLLTNNNSTFNPEPATLLETGSKPGGSFSPAADKL